jgi:hypothetical protein
VKYKAGGALLEDEAKRWQRKVELARESRAAANAETARAWEALFRGEVLADPLTKMLKGWERESPWMSPLGLGKLPGWSDLESVTRWYEESGLAEPMRVFQAIGKGFRR